MINSVGGNVWNYQLNYEISKICKIGKVTKTQISTRSWAAHSKHCSGRIHTRLSENGSYTAEWQFWAEYCWATILSKYFNWIQLTENLEQISWPQSAERIFGLEWKCVPTISSLASSPTTRAQSSSTAHWVPTGHSVIKIGSWTSCDGDPVCKFVRVLFANLLGPCVQIYKGHGVQLHMTICANTLGPYVQIC